MRTRPTLALLALLTLVTPTQADDKDKEKDEKAIEALAKKLKDAEAIFTAEIGGMKVVAVSNKIPPSEVGEITFKDGKALKGMVADGGKYAYVRTIGVTKNYDLSEKGKVLVVVKGGVTAVVPATEDNLALAKKVIDAEKEKK